MTKNTRDKNTPERILDSALKLILRDGFKGVSVDLIIKEAGISKGAFFYHFKSKDALAQTLARRFISERGRAIKSLMTQIESENKGHFYTLNRFLRLFPAVAAKKEDGCLLAAFSYQLLGDSEEIKKCCKEAALGWRNFFQPYVQRAFEEMNMRRSTPDENMADMLFCLMEGAYVLERLTEASVLEAQFNSLANLLEDLARLPNESNSLEKSGRGSV